MAFLALLTVGCRVSFSPLQNRVQVGQEPYLVFTADGEADLGDLFLARPGGGAVYPLTYTRLDESRPALAPDGGSVAFVRRTPIGPDTVERLVVMNLLNGAEREIVVGASAELLPQPRWTADGRWLVLAGRRVPAPPLVGPVEPLPGGSAAADSAEAVWLGDPPFARAIDCPEGLCLAGDSGVTLLAATAHHAFRWGADSVGYLVDGMVEVRPLGAGRTRRFSFDAPPPGLRQPSYFSGP